MNAPWDRIEIEVGVDGYVEVILGGRIWPRLWWEARRVRRRPWSGYG